MFKKKKYVYGDLIKQHRPTLHSLLFQILQEKLFNIRRKKQTIYNEGSIFIPETDRFSYLPLRYIALIQNGVVVEMIRVHVDAASILTSKKTKFVEFDPKETVVKKGMSYLDKNFVESDTSEKD